MEQLQPGHRIRTAEVFAERMGVSAEMVEMATHSPERMAWIFRHVPPERLQAYRDTVLRRSAQLINDYLREIP